MDVHLEGITVESWLTDDVCPRCGQTKLELRHLEYRGAERFELFIQACPSCGYRETQFMDEYKGRNMRYILVINRPEDYNTLVYRSPTASIAIPELGIEITPTSKALPRITTVEGLMLDLRSKIEALSDDPAAARKRLVMVDRALQGEMKVTLILTDSQGSSWLKGKEGTNIIVEGLE
jgi:zinc finger protein